MTTHILCLSQTSFFMSRWICPTRVYVLVVNNLSAGVYKKEVMQPVEGDRANDTRRVTGKRSALDTVPEKQPSCLYISFALHPTWGSCHVGVIGQAAILLCTRSTPFSLERRITRGSKADRMLLVSGQSLTSDSERVELDKHFERQADV